MYALSQTLTEPTDAFSEKARALGLDPDSPWIGGYVEWEWHKSRHLFEAVAESLHTPLVGRRILELGCHIGATAIVLARLGARVTAFDVDPDHVELARLNVARHGLGRAVDVVHVPDSRALPFARGGFDWVTCNSVLEYVDPRKLPAVLREVDRVLRPRGLMLVLGTSNRLWPREIHTGRWLTNYVPRALDRPDTSVRRGVTATALHGALPDYEDVCLARPDILREWHRRRGASGARLLAMRASSALLRPLSVTAGMLMPTLTLLLRKP
jgi:2-polyprenyl-3-methyl-5-hydroxy-6-metoxy-1,4-benzoquinol methylase